MPRRCGRGKASVGRTSGAASRALLPIDRSVAKLSDGAQYWRLACPGRPSLLSERLSATARSDCHRRGGNGNSSVPNSRNLHIHRVGSPSSLLPFSRSGECYSEPGASARARANWRVSLPCGPGKADSRSTILVTSGERRSSEERARRPSEWQLVTSDSSVK